MKYDNMCIIQSVLQRSYSQPLGAYNHEAKLKTSQELLIRDC